MSNDYVAMEKKTCPICFKNHTDHENAAIFIDTRLKGGGKFKEETDKPTGFALCKEHKAKDGFAWLVGADKDTGMTTGNVLQMKTEVLEKIVQGEGSKEILNFTKKHHWTFINNDIALSLIQQAITLEQK